MSPSIVPTVSKGTPLRPIRMPDGLWQAVQAKAESQGTNASEVVRQLLTEWVEQNDQDHHTCPHCVFSAPKTPMGEASMKRHQQKHDTPK